MANKLEHHFDTGVAHFSFLIRQHKNNVYTTLNPKNKKVRGVCLVCVKEEWLGREYDEESNKIQKEVLPVWSDHGVDGISPHFVPRKKIKISLPGIQNDLLQPILNEVDTYNPKTEIVFFIFVSGPNIKRARVIVI